MNTSQVFGDFHTKEDHDLKPAPGKLFTKPYLGKKKQYKTVLME
jgi:hypothetical protein